MHHHHWRLQSTRNRLDYPSTTKLMQIQFLSNLVFSWSTTTCNSTLHTHGNILDLVICDHEDMISYLTVDSTTCSLKSDHYLISFDAYSSIPTAQGKKHYINVYAKTDQENFNTHLQSLQPVASFVNCNDAWSHVSSKITSACKLYIPQVLIKSVPTWFTPSINMTSTRSAP